MTNTVSRHKMVNDLMATRAWLKRVDMRGIDHLIRYKDSFELETSRQNFCVRGIEFEVGSHYFIPGCFDRAPEDCYPDDGEFVFTATSCQYSIGGEIFHYTENRRIMEMIETQLEDEVLGMHEDNQY